jgi:hypothetical protein
MYIISPDTFKTVQASASGTTALWTPTSGKKFRLMKLQIQLPSNATLAAAAVLTVSLLDGASDIAITHDFYVGQVALTSATALFTSGEDGNWLDLGNGILSSTINNVLNVNLSAALASGKVRVVAIGTEE